MCHSFATETWKGDFLLSAPFLTASGLKLKPPMTSFARGSFFLLSRRTVEVLHVVLYAENVENLKMSIKKWLHLLLWL